MDSYFAVMAYRKKRRFPFFSCRLDYGLLVNVPGRRDVHHDLHGGFEHFFNGLFAPFFMENGECSVIFDTK